MPKIILGCTSFETGLSLALRLSFSSATQHLGYEVLMNSCLNS